MSPAYIPVELRRQVRIDGELRVGEQVRRADGGFGRVQAVAVEQRAQVMYNLTVAVAHTLFQSRLNGKVTLKHA